MTINKKVEKNDGRKSENRYDVIDGLLLEKLHFHFHSKRDVV